MATALVRLCDTPTFHGETHYAFPVTITTDGNDVQTDSAIVPVSSSDLNAAIVNWVKTNADHVTTDDDVILIGGIHEQT